MYACQWMCAFWLVCVHVGIYCVCGGYVLVYMCVLCIDDSNEGRINDKNQCRGGIFVVCRRRRVSSS